MDYLSFFRMHQKIVKDFEDLYVYKIPREFNALSLMNEQLCEMHAWLMEQDRTHKTSPLYKKVVEDHKTFHKCVGEIAYLKERGRSDWGEDLVKKDGNIYRCLDRLQESLFDYARMANLD